MKNKFHFIVSSLFFLIYANILPSTGGVGFVDHLIPKEKYIEKASTRSMSKKLKKELEELSASPGKYISEPTNDIEFGKTAFYSANYFYLGALAALGGGLINSSTLMRAYLTYNSDTQKNQVHFVPLAPEEVYLNDEQVDGKPAKVRNPIYDKRVSSLALMGQYPVLTLNDQTQVGTVNFGVNQLISLVDDINSGVSVKTNTEKLKDANSDDATVQGIAASYDNIFAAVYPEGGAFGANNHSGFTRLNRSEKILKQIESPAISLNLNANQLLAITQDARVGGLGDMYWDSTLKRLFIGLIGVERTNANAAGGAISILVGRIENNVLIVEPCVALNAALFTANTNEFVLGFYRDNPVVSKSFAYKLRTMHTSTGYSYLIVNGGITNLNIKNRFYALPLIKGGDVIANIGKIANKNDFSIVPANAAEMSKSTDDAVEIGVTDLITQTRNVQDMFIVGDSVYVCLAENRAANEEAGIFRSTAIFDNDGKIRAWSTWQRVMGNTDKVYGAGLDATAGNYWYLTDNVAPAPFRNTVKVTQWGKSEAVDGLMGNGLVEILNEEFKQENGGVHQIFNFDEMTPSITRDENNKQYRISMMVATGLEKIAIIKTGSGNPFTPENQFIKEAGDPNRNVYVWDNDNALKDIGPICCAELSRVENVDYGFLFVGGYGGFGVLRGVGGDGWNGRTDIAEEVDFPTISGWTFKELKKTDGTAFSQVRKIVCHKRGYLYVINTERIYRLDIHPDKFKDVEADPLDEKNITPPPGVLLDMYLFYYTNNDTRLVVATTKGLFYSDTISDDDEDKNPNWTKIQLNSGSYLSSPVSHLSFVSQQKGGYTDNGNLYAVSADLSFNLSNIYRFNVLGGNIHSIPEVVGTDYFYTIGELRTNFLTDGTFGFNLLSKHLGKSEFLRKINISSDQSNMRRNENVIDLDLKTNAYNVGVIAKNSASGAWIVPGDWGIRVND
ncbi:hypothetical protein ACFLYH_00125 [Candidatus Dependentiae bacterium]